MQASSNLSHWVCALAGLFLVLTGFLLRDIVADRTPALTGPPGSKAALKRFAGYGRRVVMIGAALLAMAYGISRMFN